MSAVRNKSTQDEAFEPPINSKHLGRLLAYLKPYKWQVIGSVIVMIIASCASLASPLILKYALDNYISVGKFEGLIFLAFGILGCSVISALGTRYRILLMNVAGRRALAKLRSDLFKHIQTLGFDFFESRSAGKIMVRIINDVNSVLSLFNNGIVNSLTNLLQLVFIIGLMLWLNWRLALIGFITLPFLMLLLFVLRPFIKRNWRKVRRKISTMNGFLQEALSGIKVTQAYVREEKTLEIFRQTNENIKTSWVSAMKINSLMGPAFEIVSVAGMIMIYYFGIRWMYPEQGLAAVSLGTLMSMIWYLGRFWQPLSVLSNIYTQVLVATASLERIFEIMDYPAAIKNNEKQFTMDNIKGDVEFKNVHFGYEEGQKVLKDISFKAKAGQSIAFVGPTGAGKSTIVNLMSRFYEVNNGTITIDDVDIKDYDLHSLRDKVGVMLQETFIFSGTIMDNIRYGRLDATDEEVIEAAKATFAHEFIMRTEKGYHTQVNERGSRLSMGQKQLLSFARTMLSNPRILILDEATASIDTHTEIQIQHAIDILMADRTSFVIAHRLSTIRKADRIIVIVDGEISETGSHEQLLEQKGHYFNLCEAQYEHMK